MTFSIWHSGQTWTNKKLLNCHPVHFAIVKLELILTLPGGAPLSSLIESNGVSSLSVGEWGWLRTEAAAWIIFTRAIAGSKVKKICSTFHCFGFNKNRLQGELFYHFSVNFMHTGSLSHHMLSKYSMYQHASFGILFVWAVEHPNWWTMCKFLINVTKAGRCYCKMW